MRDFQQPGRSVVYATGGMCATSHPLAAKVAVQMLEQGGNAVDAIIAGAVLLGQCEPAMTGIGGDLFALISPPGGDVVALNGSGRGATGLSAARMRAAGHVVVPDDGPEAVTLPGAVDAFCRMSADWGKLGLAASLAPRSTMPRPGSRSPPGPNWTGG
jgi:gamma-glutamyltranspeptidase / glutathione hydrolase